MSACAHVRGVCAHVGCAPCCFCRAKYSSDNTSATTMWLKIVSQWLAFLLMAWTLVAPKLFPDREF